MGQVGFNNLKKNYYFIDMFAHCFKTLIGPGGSTQDSTNPGPKPI